MSGKKLFLLLIFIIMSGFCFSQTTSSKYKKRAHHQTKLPASVIINDNKLGRIEIDMQSFREKAIQKTTELSNYITIITNPNESKDDVNSSIDQACKLFINENASVEVSSAKIQDRSKIKIRRYLTGLKMHPHFDKILVKYADITYVPEFRKGADGNYYSVVTFVQKFEGFIEKKMVYGDFTKKDITVILKSYAKVDANGVSRAKWDVFLSDIGVTETKGIKARHVKS